MITSRQTGFFYTLNNINPSNPCQYTTDFSIFSSFIFLPFDIIFEMN